MIVLENCLLKRENNFQLIIEKLTINKDSNTFLIGPSGSGKSTLLRILSGLESHFKGNLIVDGNGEKYLPPLNDRNIMYLSQELFLWENLSVEEHINFVLNKGRNLKNNKESEFYLSMVKLMNKKTSNIAQLSTGERQRLALARALSAKAEYLFLDEPFSNIDVVLADELNSIILDQQKRDKFGLITSTHNHIGLKGSDSKIIILDNGKIIQEGNWEQINQKPKNEWVKKWLDLV
jgi:ABC-type Fe3+/spermidine/putrescine transport system ATPase subunit